MVLGLSNVWDDDYFKPVIEDAAGNASLEGVKINREPMYDGDTTDQPTFTHVAGDCTRAPAAPDDVLPRLTSEQVKATMPDPKSRSKGKDISSLAPQSNRQKTGDSSRTPEERRDASKKRKLVVNDELSKSPAHSQREKDDALIDATEDVVPCPDVSNPRDDQLTEVLSDEYNSEGEGTSKQAASTSRG
ncbi:hypothetical protein Tco_1288049, partial [Tanacetum coccineum]